MGFWETFSLKALVTGKSFQGWRGLGVLSIAGNGYYFHFKSCSVSIGEIWVWLELLLLVERLELFLPSDDDRAPVWQLANMNSLLVPPRASTSLSL